MADPDLYPEDEIAELFAPRRSEPEAFREAVVRKIAELEGELEERDRRPMRSVLLERAAAVLPLDGLLAFNAAGKLQGAKLLPFVLALPVLLLAAAFGSFFAAARSLRHSTREVEADPGIDPRRAGALRKAQNFESGFGRGLITFIQVGSFVALMAVGLLGGRAGIDALVIILLVSMFALVVSVRGLARAGTLTRAEVVGVSLCVLHAVYLGFFVWGREFLPTLQLSPFGSVGVIVVLWIGILICYLLRFGPRTGTLIGVVVITIFALLNPFGWTRSSAHAIRDQLERMDLGVENFFAWPEAAAMYEALVGSGSEVPEMSAGRAEIARVIGQGLEFHSSFLVSAARMNLIDASQWRDLQRIDSGSGSPDDWLVDSHSGARGANSEYQLSMLLATRELTPTQRALVVQRVDATWPKPGEYGALEDAADCVRMLQWLGAEEHIDAHRDQAHALLEEHWVTGEGAGLFASVGGFSSNPKKHRTSFELPTWCGVELISRYGTPPEIDKARLIAYLRGKARPDWLFSDEVGFHAHARASLLLLGPLPALPEATLIKALLDERLFIAMVLLVVLCLIAIGLAPPTVVDEEEAEGALP